MSVTRRIGVTLGLLVVVLAGRRIPVPGFDHAAWSRYAADGPGSATPISIFSAGIEAYMSAAVLLLLLSGFVPALRRLRDGDPAQTRRFDGIILLLTAVFALIRAVGLTLFALNLSDTLPGSSAVQPALIVPSVMAGALGLAWVAVLITRYGIGNGVALVLLAHLVLDLPHAVLDMLRDLNRRDGIGMLYVLSGAVILGTMVLCVMVLRARREIALVRTGGEGRAPGPGSAAPALRVPFNTVGGLPVAVAAMLAGIPMTLAEMGFDMPAAWMPGSIAPFRLVLEWGVIILATYLFTAWGYGTRNATAVLERFGYRPAEAAGAGEAGPLIDRALGTLVLPFGLFLCFLSVLPLLLLHLLGVEYAVARLAGIPVLVMTAVIMDTRRQLASLIAIAPDRHDSVVLFESGDEPDEEDAGDADEDMRWVAVAVVDTELEADLIRAELSRESIEAVVHANRWMSAVGTLSLWGCCRPAYPALMPHRRLAEGAVTVFVRETDAARARASIPAGG